MSIKTICFGHYPQNGENPEPLEWLVLEESEQEMLLLCKYSIASKGFVFHCDQESYEHRKLLWEFSDLRNWLHNEFYPRAFCEEEKALILTTVIKTMANDTDPLEIFENKVFLLSKEQVEQHLATPELRKGTRTINAANDPNVLKSDRSKLENIPWWILPYIEVGAKICVNTGKDKNAHYSYIAYPQMVYDQGTQYHGRNVYHIDWSVRPAMRISKIPKGDTSGMKLMCGGQEVSKSWVCQAIREYEQKTASPAFQKEVREAADFLQAVPKSSEKKKRYSYCRLGSLDKIYKLDHEKYCAYVLNADRVWEPCVNGVYEDFAHGHIGSVGVELDDIYPMISTINRIDEKGKKSMNPQYNVLGKQNNQPFAEEDIPIAEIEIIEDELDVVIEQQEGALMAVEDVFHIFGRGTVIVGTIQSGTVSVGESVTANGKVYVVAALEIFKKLINTASRGMVVGMLLKDAVKKDFKRGDLVYKKL